jgi:hypothetical protein
VPYPGPAPSLNALLSGTVDFSLLPPSIAIAQTRGRRLRALAVTGAQRHPELPDVPTLSGVGFDVECRTTDSSAAATLPEVLAPRAASPHVTARSFSKEWRRLPVDYATRRAAAPPGAAAEAGGDGAVIEGRTGAAPARHPPGFTVSPVSVVRNVSARSGTRRARGFVNKDEAACRSRR